jgi:hypothetical protein
MCIEYLSRASELPKQGWFQACFRCHVPTARLYHYKTIEKKTFIVKYQVHLCNDCKKTLYNPKILENLHYQCEKKITSNTFTVP